MHTLQASLSVYPETIPHEPGGAELSIKQESLEHGPWPGPPGSPYGSSDVAGRAKRASSSTGGRFCISELSCIVL